MKPLKLLFRELFSVDSVLLAEGEVDTVLPLEIVHIREWFAA